MRASNETEAALTPRLLFREGFLDTTPGIDIVGEREGNLVECYVDIDLINTEDVAVSRSHVKALADSITDERQRNKTEKGQLTAILLGLVEGEQQLSIIDGFHRTAALKVAGDPTVYATIRPSTREDVIDLRILTARTHKAVQFARIVEWVTESWGRTEWSKKISPVQAFTLYQQLGNGRNLGVSEEIPEIRSWVEHKCDQWQVPATTIRSILAIAVVADPVLVQEARHQNSGRTLEYITPGHLSVIALGLPNKFDVQRFVAETTKQHNLRIPQSRYLVSLLSKTTSLEEAQKAIKPLDLSKVPSELARKKHDDSLEATSSVEDVAAEVRLQTSEMTLDLESGGVLAGMEKALANTRTLLWKIRNGSVGASKNELIIARNDLRRMAELTVRLAQEAGNLARSQPQTPPEIEGPTTKIEDRGLIVELANRQSRKPIIDSDVSITEQPTYDRDNPIVGYLLGRCVLPVIETIDQARFIEKLLREPPRGSNTEKSKISVKQPVRLSKPICQRANRV